VWRSECLQGACELRNSVPQIDGAELAAALIKAMSPELLFDDFAVRLNGQKARGNKLGRSDRTCAFSAGRMLLASTCARSRRSMLHLASMFEGSGEAETAAQKAEPFACRA
jgi:hypothetical protein